MKIIHARKRGEDVVFRVWSTTVDAYYTEPSTEEQTRIFLAMCDIGHALDMFEFQIGERIGRAKEHGTSEVGSKSDLDGPWMRQSKRSHSPVAEEFYWELMEKRKKLLEKILASWPERPK